MFLEKTRAELLRSLVADREDRDQIDALQSFTVCMGERLGVEEEALWIWRCAVVWWMTGRPVELEESIGLLTHKELYSVVAQCAGAWLGGIEPSLDIAGSQEALDAWKYTADLIVALHD